MTSTLKPVTMPKSAVTFTRPLLTFLKLCFPLRYSVGNCTVSLEPKDWIALAALAGTIGNFGWTYRNKRTEDQRWKSLNDGRIDLKELKVKPWRAVSREEASGIDWGHVAQLVGGQLPSGQFRLPYCIAARRASDGELVPGWTHVTTVAEARKEAARLGVEFGALTLCRMVRPEFTFENLGKTDALDGTLDVWARVDKGEWTKAFHTTSPATIPPGKESGFFFDMFFPISAPFPMLFEFKIKSQYKTVDGGARSKELAVSWQVSTDSYFYGTVALPTPSPG